MKSITEYLTFHLPARMEFVNITPQVEAVVEKSGIREGLVLVNAMHITASVFINDDEPGLHADYKKWLEQLAPFDPSPARYQHNRTGEDNADAHLKRQVMGREVVVAITDGRRIRRQPAETRVGQGDRRLKGKRRKDESRRAD
jgi:secondary thiamine-phosphate synthase enzyme